MPALIRPYPYAAKAYVQHEFDVDHLNVWLTFRHPMDQTVKPAHNLWTCEVDTVNKAVTASAWQSEFTLLLTVGAVGAFPDRVLLSYDGPDDSLRTTWLKQWEPWTEILSVSVPYGWEGVIFIDIINKRVGIAGPPLARTFEVVDPVTGDRISIYHDGTNAYIKTSDGSFILQTDEGVNTSTILRILGKGTGIGRFECYDQDDSEYLSLFCSFGRSQLLCSGLAPQSLVLQFNATVPVDVFLNATESETQKCRLYGWKAGDSQLRHVDLQISPNADNTALWSGVPDYVFDGNLRSTGRLVSGTLTHSVLGPTEDLDVSGVNIVFLDCSLNDVIIGAFVGGVAGQKLSLARLCAAANDATLEHNEGTINQNIFLHKGLDETLTGEYGGWELVCNGTSWFDVSHAKHA